MLRFEINGVRVVEDSDKKYVSYKIIIWLEDVEHSKEPSVLERRYTDFLNLYNDLKKDFPALMSGIYFPKKVVLGNFNPELISCRKSSFESLLDYIAKDSRLREAPCTIDFFQGIEFRDVKKFMSENKFDQALYLLENNFQLLNKIYTDRSRVVLIALCRLVACGAGGASTDPDKYAALAGPVECWASLAMRRFDGVSDTDLLTLYVPLIRTCIYIWKVLGKDSQPLENSLSNMRRRGMKVDTCPDLMEAIDNLELSCTETS